MVKVGKKIVKYRVVILILSVLLLIPSAMGYFGTRINYDVLTYLPENIETMKGQDIMVNDFGTGAFSMLIVDGMEDKDVAKLKEKVEDVDHVTKVLWYDSVSDISIPESMLPDKCSLMNPHQRTVRWMPLHRSVRLRVSSALSVVCQQSLQIPET